MTHIYVRFTMLCYLLCAPTLFFAQQDSKINSNNIPYGLRDTIVDYGFVQVAPFGSTEFKSKGPDAIKIDYDFNKGESVLIRFVDTTFYFEKLKDTINTDGNKFTAGYSLDDHYIFIHRSANLAVLHFEADQIKMRLFTKKYIEEIEKDEDNAKNK